MKQNRQRFILPAIVAVVVFGLSWRQGLTDLQSQRAASQNAATESTAVAERVAVAESTAAAESTAVAESTVAAESTAAAESATAAAKSAAVEKFADQSTKASEAAASKDMSSEEAEDSVELTDVDSEPSEPSESKERYTEEGVAVPDFGDLKFRYPDRLKDHYKKHGREMGFSSAEEYEAAANRVVHDDRALIKLEEEDGDFVFYIEETNDFVIVSTDGYIRTYFWPNGGKSYYLRQ